MPMFGCCHECCLLCYDKVTSLGTPHSSPQRATPWHGSSMPHSLAVPLADLAELPSAWEEAVAMLVERHSQHPVCATAHHEGTGKDSVEPCHLHCECSKRQCWLHSKHR